MVEPAGVPLATPGAWTPARRTGALALGLAVLSVISFLAGGFADDSAIHPLLPWFAVAALTVAADLLVFHVELRRETYRFALTEVPMVMGLLFARPTELIAGRLLGELLIQVVKERQHVRKVALNLSSFLAECVTMLVVYRLLGTPTDVEHPLTWAAVLVAVAVAQTVGYFVVVQAIVWHGRPADRRAVVTAGLLTAVVNTGLGLAGAVLLVTSPWATLLLTSVALFLVGSYRAYERLGERFASLTLLYDFTRYTSAARTPDAMLDSILVHAKDLLVAERAEIWLLDGDDAVGRQADRIATSITRVPAAAAATVDRWLAHGPLVHARRGGRAVHPEIAEALGARECLLAPLTESGERIGVIIVIDPVEEVNSFRPRDLKLFATLASHASSALENGRLIDRLHEAARAREHEALHDSLTGLPNRVLFSRRLAEVLSEAHPAAHTTVVGLLDLDGFKEVNDTFGHHRGDEVLAELARRMARVLDPSATLARLGGDEFALVLPDADDDEAARVARRLRNAVARPLTVDGREIVMGVSIGLARETGHETDGATLMRRADAAMYRAKSAAKRGAPVDLVFAHDPGTPRTDLA